mgnify:CR=1 FL=1
MMQNLGTEAWTLATSYAARVIGVLVALFVAWIVAGLVKRAMSRAFERARFDKTLSRFFSNLARYGILTMAVLGCLGVFGIETSSFAAVLAAMGLAIGLAFQGTLSNFASGVMLLVFRPFGVDDYVEVGGTSGTVREIELFTTELVTVDNRRVVVPNSQIFGNTITNYTAFETRRCDVSVGTEYGADLDEVRAVLRRAIDRTDKILDDPEPVVFLAGLGSSSIDWSVRAWVRTEDLWDVKDALTRQVKVELDAAGIGIPFPQMDVHLDRPDDAA